VLDEAVGSGTWAVRFRPRAKKTSEVVLKWLIINLVRL